MNDYDIAWIMSGGIKRSKSESEALIEAIGAFMRNKKSLYIWSDNKPLFIESNIILEHFFNGMTVNN